ncbi:MAG: hypothetical protein IJT56_06340 [Clostridia bacterium]|nr:hypothetical protein [Clostridia bacterium]
MFQIIPLPAGEPASELYSVKINGTPAGCSVCRVSAMPFDVVWPGHQRPIDQTEEAAFVSVISDGKITVEVKKAAQAGGVRPDSDVTVRPLRFGIKPVIDGDTAKFDLPGPGQYSVEIDGMHSALTVFVDPPFDFGPKEGPGITYYGPGVHDIGEIRMRSNETVYIDAGAVVYGGIVAEDASNIRVVGYGILDNSRSVREENHAYVKQMKYPLGNMKLFRCVNAEIHGPVFRDSGVWTATMYNCDNVTFDRCKAIGMWRYNSDGFDFVNSANCRVLNSYLRNYDDVIVLKGLKGWDHRNVENIHVKNCVTWCDWGRNLEIGAETCADEYRNIIFEDCDCIHGAHIMLDIQNGDRASVHELIFDNIRCEYSKYQTEPIYQSTEDMKYEPDTSKPYLPMLMKAHLYRGVWSKDMLYGENKRVTFRNIQVFADDGLTMPPSEFSGADDAHWTRGITIENLTFNGRPVTSLDEANVRIGDFAEDILVK